MPELTPNLLDTPQLQPTWRELSGSYYQLTKPRIIPLLLVTTSAAMILAGHGQVDPLLLVVTNLGGTLAAASAQVLNCIYDGDIDYAMERTRHRPIPSEKISVTHAAIFATLLGLLAFWLLLLGANRVAALWAMAGIGFYVVIYTHFLKRHTAQNIVIGGAAGAIPALVGWAAVTGQVSPPAWLLFAIVCLWTPPHFWSLALILKEDYAKVGVPMLPVVAGEVATVRQIAAYSAALVPASLFMATPIGGAGLLYGVAALGLALGLGRQVYHLYHQPTDQGRARSLFKGSIFYLMLLCTALMVDSIPALHFSWY
jgi:heme o synthase